MKKNSPLWILGIIAIFVLLIVNIVMSMRMSEYGERLDSSPETNISIEGKTETGDKCPDATGGLKDSFLQVKYFYSKFCPWCKREEPILQNIVRGYGNLIHIEWYNINSCPDMVTKYKVSGVPTLVFSTADNLTEYSHYGFTYEKDLMDLMCDVTGGC